MEDINIYERLTSLETTVKQYLETATKIHQDHETRIRRVETYGLIIVVVFFSMFSVGTDVFNNILTIFKVV